MILGIELGRILLNFGGGIEDAQDKDCGTRVEREDNRIGNNALGGYIADTYARKYEGEDLTDKTTCVAEETLNRVG